VLAAKAVAVLIVVTILPFLLSVASVLPASAGGWLLRLTPAAAFAIMQSIPQYPQVSSACTPGMGCYPLAPWVGFAVLCGYAALAMGRRPGAPAPRRVSREPRLAPVSVPWLARRLFPVLATACLIAIGIGSTTWWGPHLAGKPGWLLPDDLWGTLTAARSLLHLRLGGLYTPATRLISLPGAAVILVPVVAVTSAAGISVQAPGPLNSHPAVWLIAGPYEIGLSAVALFAADALAGRLGVPRSRRALLAAAGALALWNVSVRWGHPEDAVAVGLLLYGALALSGARPGRAAWLTGAAIAVQPLVLLALPIVATAIPPRRLTGFGVRAAAPGVVLLAAAAAANWTATFSVVTSQPNWPALDHPTPWATLAPRLGHAAVSAGPGRALAIVAACGCALVAGRRWRAGHGWRAGAGWRAGGDAAGWRPESLEVLLWWIAVALALRAVFEPVMVSYYLWPVLAVALIAASRSWPRLIATSLAATTLTVVSQASWRGPWSWWAPMVAGLGLTLFLARVPLRASARRAPPRAGARRAPPGPSGAAAADRPVPSGAAGDLDRAVPADRDQAGLRAGRLPGF
jgi:hypothetical protein